ncbi:uncharacterized protein LOC123313737 isoform X2 [Coccinella septempunctata]|uniref:uncharacterized protein LOC123313737 isoform X2 n=1 Tax=Coccinella septempunctata TaxID=41139 RepID=UPI001D0955B4|nr:uncharacterized protein LOC123313737 isoform X2 [Coccinella septempunctata]
MSKPFVTDDIISEIKNNKFTFHLLEPDKQSAIRQNRSKPDLDLQHNDGGTWRRFNPKWYDEFPWLCGSKSVNKLFCIACVIYGGDNSWAYDGVDSIKKFPEKANKHELSKGHIKNMELYIMAGKNRIIRESTNGRESEKDSFERKEVLSKIIDALIVLNRYGQKLELFNENDKNPVGELVMKKYLCDVSVYRRIYSDVNGRIVKLMESQLFKDIKKEISQTEFCSILVDTIPKMTNEYSVMVRYVHGGVVKERFVGLYKIVQIFDLAQIFNTVTGDVRKAVCHSYDGSHLMKPLRLGIKTIMPKLLFLPNHFHRLSTLVLQNLESIDEIRSFIRNVTFICNFFKVPNRAHYLTIYGLNFPLESETLWKFHSKAIHSILTQQTRILKIVNNIILDPYVIDLDSVNSAYIVQKNLHCPLFMMFCYLFSKIFAHIDHLSNTIQKKLHEDVPFCIQEVEQTIKNISNVKATVCINHCLDENKIRLSKEDLSSDKVKIFKSATAAAINLIANQIIDIFGDIKYLRFVELLDETKFTGYWNKFPKVFFFDIMEFYKGFFDLCRLENELTMIYADPSKKFNPRQLFCFLYDNELTETYKETFKLLKLYLTYPLSPFENGSSSKWTKLKKFLSLPQSSDKSAMLYVESYDQNSPEYEDFKKSVIQVLSTPVPENILC